MLNKWVGMARLTKHHELKQTQSGIDVCSFSIACDRDFKNGDEKVTDFINCTAWRHTATFISKYFSKGSMIIIDGRISTDKYVDKDGNNRTKTEVTVDNAYFGSSKNSGGQGGSDTNSSGQVGSPFVAQSGDDGELPF